MTSGPELLRNGRLSKRGCYVRKAGGHGDDKAPIRLEQSAQVTKELKTLGWWNFIEKVKGEDAVERLRRPRQCGDAIA
jgi:hypothetical protein